MVERSPSRINACDVCSGGGVSGGYSGWDAGDPLFTLLLPPTDIAVERVGADERPAQDCGETGEVAERRQDVSDDFFGEDCGRSGKEDGLHGGLLGSRLHYPAPVALV